MTDCLACDAGYKPVTVNYSVTMPDDGKPKRKADFVRKAPSSHLYAYLWTGPMNGKCGYYAVALISMNQWSYKITDGPSDTLRMVSSEHLGFVFKRGTKFYAVTPDGKRKRSKGASSVRKATRHLWTWRPQ